MIDPASQSDATADQPMQVLMAEDSASMRVLLRAQLTDWGLDVIPAKDGAEAWELFLQHQPSLVLTDWIMPEVDGLELIRRIRSHPIDHYVYVLLLTAKTDKEDLVLAMDAGADDFLVKPCDNQELRVRLREGKRILDLEQTLAQKNLEIRNAQAALVENEKLASLGRLAAGMAHEINNPIAYVNNNLSVLKRDVTALLEILDAYEHSRHEFRQACPQAAETIQRLQREHDLGWIRQNTQPLFDSSIAGLRRVRDIVRNLREFARLDEADHDTIRIGDTIRRVLSILHQMLDEKQINVQLNDGGNPEIHCRPVAINQVLHNLISNAIQASDSGGQIMINITAEDERLVITITDHGVGIAARDLPHIFEPFFTTRSIGQGPGLGLSLCYGVIRDHGGQIQVDSQPGQGTTVRVELPRGQ